MLRLAVTLDRGRSGAIANLDTYDDDENKTLTIHLTPVRPDNNCELKLWNIDYKKAWFEEVFGLEVNAQLAAQGVIP